jgi:C_GCAxxG_C_C family probable redox protein
MKASVIHMTESTIDSQQIISCIEKRAENLFLTRQYQCSEAVTTVINSGFSGDLSPESAMGVASGLAEGMGGSGCTCGALTGGIVALGLFLGRKQPGIRNADIIMKASRAFHEHFKDKFGLPCCRLLTKDVVNGSNEHFLKCADQTRWAAGQVAQLIIRYHPEVVGKVNWKYLRRNESPFQAGIKKIMNTLRS